MGTNAEQFVAIWRPLYEIMRDKGIRPADMRKEWKRLGGVEGVMASVVAGVIGVVVATVASTVVGNLFGYGFIPADEMTVVSSGTGRKVTLPTRGAVSLIHRRGWLTKDIDTVFSMGYQFAYLQAHKEKAKENRKSKEAILEVLVRQFSAKYRRYRRLGVSPVRAIRLCWRKR